jgi:FAD dependent oxidoreductase TIGR03364
MESNFDLIVTGGGILGTFHAWHALQAGKKVLLLEKDNYPVGATVRNFGQVVPSGMTGRWFEYGVQALDIYRSIQQEFDISVRNNGSVYVASDDDEQTLIHELKAWYDTRGYEARLLSKAAVLKKYPALRETYVKEAIFFPQELSVEPEKMIYRLQEYMRTKFPSFTLLYNSPVIGCGPAAGGVLVTVSGGAQYRAAKAVVCNGYEFKLLYPEIFRNSGLVVSKLQMLRTSPMPQVELEGNVLTGLTIRRYESFEEHCPSFAAIATPERYREYRDWGIHLLFKKASDGSIIIGDSHEYAPAERFDDLGFGSSEHINRLMLQEAARIVQFDLDIVASWCGFYPQHNEKHIFEQDIDGCIHIRTGIGGKGMTAGAGYAGESIRRLWGA